MERVDKKGKNRNIPTRKAHMTSEAFERLNICVCSSVSISELITGDASYMKIQDKVTYGLECAVRGVRLL